MAPLLPTGTRVALTRDVDRYPHFIAPNGATGTVVDHGDPSIVLAVRLDDRLAGAEDWDNEVHWLDADVELGNDPLDDIVEL
jgi:hypothetical protein